MKSIFLSFVFLFTFITGLNAQNVNNDLVIKNAVKTATAQELAQNRAQLNFPGIDAKEFTPAEIDRLAGGLTVTKKTVQFPIITQIFPLVKIVDAYRLSSYRSEKGTVHSIESVEKISQSHIDILISIILLASLMLTIMTEIVSGIILIDNHKVDLTIYIALTDIWIVASVFIGLLIGLINVGALVWIFFILTVSLLIVLSIDTSLEQKALLLTSLPAGIILGGFSGRLASLDFSISSPQMAPIWGYVGVYVMISIIGLVLMWKIKSPEEAIYIGSRSRT